jgi:hypothetical protein
MFRDSTIRLQIQLAVVVAACLGLYLGNTAYAEVRDSSPPNTVFWDGAHLASLRAGQLDKDPLLKKFAKRLRKNADISLRRGPYSVTYKDDSPPSGDKNDYLSYARYWWPNPDTADGLPYIRRDGKTNEELLAKGDREPIGMLYDDLETVALAAYLFDDDRYAKHGTKLVRTWFLDPATRMNPHLRYGQAVPGRNDGRGSGIIDTRHFIRVLDAVALLDETDAWTEADQAALKVWMKQYLDWLRHDPLAEDERSEKNNHGTWYDAQLAAIAMFVGERDLARQIVEDAKQFRIERAIEPDGQQHEEQRRTKGLHYCVFNLSAMSVLARIGEHVGVDLWSYESIDGRSIRQALDFVMPYLLGKKEWPHEQIADMYVSPSDTGLFYLAAQRYDEPRYLRAVEKEIKDPRKFQYAPLLFPDN